MATQVAHCTTPGGTIHVDYNIPHPGLAPLSAMLPCPCLQGSFCWVGMATAAQTGHLLKSLSQSALALSQVLVEARAHPMGAAGEDGGAPEPGGAFLLLGWWEIHSHRFTSLAHPLV